MQRLPHVTLRLNVNILGKLFHKSFHLKYLIFGLAHQIFRFRLWLGFKLTDWLLSSWTQFIHQTSQFWPNFTIWTNFSNFVQISHFVFTTQQKLHCAVLSFAAYRIFNTFFCRTCCYFEMEYCMILYFRWVILTWKGTRWKIDYPGATKPRQ